MARIIPLDDLKKAAENRERVAKSRQDTPYYWWEFPENIVPEKAPEKGETGTEFKGLTWSRAELKKRSK